LHVFFTRLASGGIPRGIARSGLAILSYGFRPFFLLAGIWAVVAMGLWIAALILDWPVGGSYGPVNWHAHEMVFGYTGAALAGFMLTAIPDWTGRLPVSGGPLLALVLVWLTGRAAMLFPDLIGLEAALMVEALFLPVLFVVALREIVAGRNWKNLKIVLALALLSVANGWFHVAVLTTGNAAAAGRLGVASWIVLIALVGGRIIPSFTRNWLARHGSPVLPAPFGRFDKLAVLVLLATLACWVAVPQHWATSILCGAAGALHALRLWRWRGWLAASEPIVLILHIAYGFLALGLSVLAASGTGLLTEASAVHVLTIGALGGMTLAVMSRAALGHTGRPIIAGPAIVAAYGFVCLAAFVRPALDFLPDLYHAVLGASALLWMLAFGAFVAVYAPILLSPRPQKT
jgi:uncharacterized protein involved in response to NO